MPAQRSCLHLVVVLAQSRGTEWDRGLQAAAGAGGTVEDALDELVGPAAGQQEQVGQGEAVAHERQAAQRPPGPLRVHGRGQVARSAAGRPTAAAPGPGPPARRRSGAGSPRARPSRRGTGPCRCGAPPTSRTSARPRPSTRPRAGRVGSRPIQHVVHPRAQVVGRREGRRGRAPRGRRPRGRPPTARRRRRSPRRPARRAGRARCRRPSRPCRAGG